MRNSNLTEHKLDFRRFLSSESAHALLEDIAADLMVSSEDVVSRVAQFPELDFYMMSKAQRAEWLPEQPVAVAAHLDTIPPAEAYAADGHPFGLRLREGILPSVALLVLQAAEPKETFVVDRVSVSRLIQHPMEARSRGNPLAGAQCDPEDDPESCQGGGGDGGGGGGGCVDYRLRMVATWNVYDNNNPLEGNEIEVHGDDGTVLDYARVTEVGPNDIVYVNKSVICTSGSVSFAAKETDGWPNPDDDFALPFPNTSKWFGLPNGVGTYLYSWPSGLDPLYSNWKVGVAVEW